MARDDAGGTVDRGSDDDFGREIDLLRSLGDDPVELVDAPDDLWGRIASSVEPDAAAGPGAPGAADAGASSPGAPARLRAHDGGATWGATGASAADRTGRAGGDGRRRWRTVVLGAAAAVVVVVAVTVGTVVATRDQASTEVAAAQLTPFEGAPVGEAGGSVELIEQGDQVRLRVAMHDLPAPAPGTFYELWLLDPETGQPVSVATMKDGSSEVTTEIDVPAGIDPARFDVVDVSVQEETAGPEHSGNSVLRGTLSA